MSTKKIMINNLGDVYLPRITGAQQRMEKMLVYMVQSNKLTRQKYYEMKSALFDINQWYIELRDIRQNVIEVTPYWFDGKVAKDMGNRTSYDISDPDKLYSREGYLTYYFWTGLGNPFRI